MRQKARNALSTFFYPGRHAGIGVIDHDAPGIAVPDGGEHVSIWGPKVHGEQPCAVFYDPQDLRNLAHVLEEAADLFEENQAKRRVKP